MLTSWEILKIWQLSLFGLFAYEAFAGGDTVHSVKRLVVFGVCLIISLIPQTQTKGE